MVTERIIDRGRPTSDPIDRYLGEDRTDYSLSMRVEREAESISLELEGQQRLLLRPHSDKEWVAKAIDVRVEFNESHLRLRQLEGMVEVQKM